MARLRHARFSRVDDVLGIYTYGVSIALAGINQARARYGGRFICIPQNQGIGVFSR